MKIVQTLWTSSENYSKGLMNTGGWRSPEYNWFSWALSSLQIRTFYRDLTLYGDRISHDILVNQLKLPYTDFQLLPPINAPEQAWVLCKVYTYSKQNEPFLHIDGDVFIWEEFDKSFLNNAIICQNIEMDFSFYPQILQEVKQFFKFIPSCLQKESFNSFYAANAGVLGGADNDFLRKYAKIVFEFVEKNEQHFSKIKNPYLCMVIEQLILFQLAKEHDIVITGLHQPVTDSLYPGFINFRDVPYNCKYIHAMGDNKKDEDTCVRLSKRLRQDYPQNYYHILKKCVQAGVQIENKAYSLSELSPILYDFSYFENLENEYLNNGLKMNSWLYFYGKEMANHRTAQFVFSQSMSSILNFIVGIDSSTEIITLQEEPLKQVLKIPNIRKLETIETQLSNLDMVILDSILEEEKNIHAIIEEICVYFSTKADNREFQNLVVLQIRELFNLGAVKMIL